MVVGQGRAGTGAMGTIRGLGRERRGLERWGLGTNELWDVKGGARYTWGVCLIDWLDKSSVPEIEGPGEGQFWGKTLSSVWDIVATKGLKEVQVINGDMLRQNIMQGIINLFFFPSLETVRKVGEIHRLLEKSHSEFASRV